jgi:DNA-binding MurR/RpiR family transcriptional regulator
MEYPAVKERIIDRFQSLSPQLRVAAQYIIDRPDDVALNSMRRVADLAGVQPATMVRLAQALGYSSYNEFRAPFNNRLRGRKGDYSARAKVLRSRITEDDFEALHRDLEAAGRENLTEAFVGNPPATLTGFCDRLFGADHIYVLGLRGSYPVAFSFHYGYSMFRSNATLLNGQGGTFTDSLRRLGPTDVLFAIGFMPYAAETIQTLDYAKTKGACILALTDSELSPLKESADLALLAPSGSPSFYQSFVAPLALAEGLVAYLAQRGGDEVLTDIENSENQLRDFNAYWDGNVTGNRKFAANRRNSL